MSSIPPMSHLQWCIPGAIARTPTVIRADVIEVVAVDLIDEAGVGARMHREGLVHSRTQIYVEGVGHRIDFEVLTGETATVYGATEIAKNLMDCRSGPGAPTVYSAEQAWKVFFSRRLPHCFL